MVVLITVKITKIFNVAVGHLSIGGVNRRRDNENYISIVGVQGLLKIYNKIYFY